MTRSLLFLLESLRIIFCAKFLQGIGLRVAKFLQGFGLRGEVLARYRFKAHTGMVDFGDNDNHSHIRIHTQSE